jgi:hypothetical protein
VYGYFFFVGRYTSRTNPFDSRIRRYVPREVLAADVIVGRKKNGAGAGWEVVRWWMLNPHDGQDTRPRAAIRAKNHQVLADGSIYDTIPNNIIMGMAQGNDVWEFRGVFKRRNGSDYLAAPD